MSDNKFEWSDKTIKELFEYVFPLTAPAPYDFQKWIDHFKKSKGFTPIEKDFEILSFKQNSGTTDLWTEFSHGWCRNVNGVAATGKYSYEGILANPLYLIHSVKRLSDNSVWTVTERTPYGVIERFSIEGSWGVNAHFTNGCGGTLSSLVKIPAKKILGTTHDGKVCYEGDTFPLWMVWPKESFELHQITAWLCLWDIERVYFFDKSKALQYINENKPKQVLFTTDDGVKVFADDGYLLHLVDNKFGVWSNAAKFCTGDPNTKYFYDLNNRSNYILKNKPIPISLNEIQGIINTVADGAKGHDNKMYLRDKFYEIFKSKIQQP